jgi:hypothetical protein
MLSCRNRTGRHRPSTRASQSGSGVIEAASDIAKTLYNIPGAALANARLSQEFPGERHPVQRVGDSWQRGQFMGPGTNIATRLRRGDKGLTPSDMVSKAHDIRYGLATDYNGLREADNKMINSMQRIKAAKADHPLNIALGLRGIEAKKKLEDMKIIKPNTFTSYGGIPPEDLPLLEENLEKLEQKGLGGPGAMLKKKLLKKLSKQKQIQKELGKSLGGGRDRKLRLYVKNKFIPAVFQTVGLKNKLTSKSVDRVLSKAIQPKSISRSILNMSKATQMMLKGSGMAGAGKEHVKDLVREMTQLVSFKNGVNQAGEGKFLGLSGKRWKKIGKTTGNIALKAAPVIIPLLL